MKQLDPATLTIEVKHTGEKLVLRRLKNENGIEELHLFGTLPPRSQGPPLHIHFGEDEHGEVVSGTLSALLDGARLSVEPGGRARFPKGRPHRWWNDGDEELVLRGVATPALIWIGTFTRYSRCSTQVLQGDRPYSTWRTSFIGIARPNWR